MVHIRDPPHCVEMMDTNRWWKCFIPATVELTILLAASKSFRRLPLKKLAWVPLLPPSNLSLESREVSFINDYQVQIAQFLCWIVPHRCPHLRPRRDTETDVAASSQIEIFWMNTYSFSHRFQKITVVVELWERPRCTYHEVPIHESQRISFRQVE